MILKAFRRFCVILSITEGEDMHTVPKMCFATYHLQFTSPLVPFQFCNFKVNYVAYKHCHTTVFIMYVSNLKF